MGMLSTPLFAQQKKGMRDPKTRTERMAEKLNFTETQKVQLKELNDKYSGDTYDKDAYRQQFQQILTAEQRKQVEQWKEQRMQKGKRKS